MNILDFFILIIALRYLLKKKNRRLVFSLINSIAIATGYLLGFVMSVNFAKDLDFDIDKGIIALVLMIGTATVFRVVIAIIRYIYVQIKIDISSDKTSSLPVNEVANIRLEGNSGYLKHKLVEPKIKEPVTWSVVNAWLAIPYRSMFLMASIYIMSQTLFYIPIQLIQFTIQGSGFMMASARLLPDSPISNLAKQYSPKRFESGRLDYSVDLSNSGSFRQVVDKLSPSIVRIESEKCGKAIIGSGSGSVIAPGLVVTNSHVITGASAVFIVNHFGKYPATPTYIDKDHDIAILYSKYLDDKSSPIAISSESPKIGSEAVSVGYPAISDGKFSTIVGAVGFGVTDSINTKLDSSSTYLLSKGMGGGSSGGPVLNMKNEIIGMNVAQGSAGLVVINANLLKEAIGRANLLPIPAFSLICEYTARAY